MYINHDDLTGMATGPAGQGENMLKAMDREIVSLKRLVQNNKQNISALKRHTGDGIGEVRPTDSTSRINARWTNDELLLAVQGIHFCFVHNLSYEIRICKKNGVFDKVLQ
jgi:hypothetical protein